MLVARFLAAQPRPLVLATVLLIVATVAASALAYLLAYPLAGAAGGELAGAVVSIIGLWTRYGGRSAASDRSGEGDA